MNPGVLVLGIAVCLLAALVLLFFVIAPPAPEFARDRRDAPGVEHVSALSRVTPRPPPAVDSLMARRRGRLFGDEELDLAGLKSTRSQFVVMVASLASVAALLGVLLGLANGTSVLLAILFALLTPIGAKLFLIVRTSRRRAKFADQIDDSLQLIAGSLRAGHGLSTALASVATDADAPMSEELARVVNEIAARSQSCRSARDHGAAHAEQGLRVGCAGDRDQRGDGRQPRRGARSSRKTIRERNQIRRQVAALSAEGRLSGIILVVLPIALFLFLPSSGPTTPPCSSTP